MNVKKSKNFKLKNQEISKSKNFKIEDQEISNRKIRKFQNDYGHYKIVHYPKNQEISKSKNFKQENQKISKWSDWCMSDERFIKRIDNLDTIRFKLALLQFMAIEIWLNSRENDE